MMKKTKFLIIRPDRIGDVVLSTHLPREIKTNILNSFVSVMVTSYTKDIYKNNPYVDEILVYDKNEDFFSVVKKIKKYNFDVSFSLLPNERLNYILTLSGIKYRLGVGHKFYQFITNTKSVYRRKYIENRHEADYCSDFLRKFDISNINNNPEIFLSREEKAKSLSIRNNFSNRVLIGINSTSGNSSANLSVNEYMLLVNEFLKDKRVKVVITDLNPPDELKKLEDVLYINLNSNLRESIINFSALDILISASTGPMHICSALGIKTLSLFCPLPACTPSLWGPLGNESYILIPEENYCQLRCPQNPKLCTFENSININHYTILNKIKEIFKLDEK